MGETKVSGLFSKGLLAGNLPAWEDQDEPTKRAEFITP